MNSTENSTENFKDGEHEVGQAPCSPSGVLIRMSGWVVALRKRLAGVVAVTRQLDRAFWGRTLRPRLAVCAVRVAHMPYAKTLCVLVPGQGHPEARLLLWMPVVDGNAKMYQNRE